MPFQPIIILVSQQPLPIIKNVRMLRRNMSAEQITMEELEHQLRRNCDATALPM